MGYVWRLDAREKTEVKHDMPNKPLHKKTTALTD